MREHPNGLTAEQWMEALDRIAQNLDKPARLCLMGSATNIFEGMQGRMSIDLDVWRRMSKFNEPSLKRAVEEAGLLFNPKDGAEPDRPYIQIVEPGIAHAGDFFEQPELLPQNGNLQITRPPIENLIASKMARMRDKDIEDIQHLLSKHPEVTKAGIAAAVKTLPKDLRETAKENLIYVDILQPTVRPPAAEIDVS